MKSGKVMTMDDGRERIWADFVRVAMLDRFPEQGITVQEDEDSPGMWWVLGLRTKGQRRDQEAHYVEQHPDFRSAMRAAVELAVDGLDQGQAKWLLRKIAEELIERRADGALWTLLADSPPISEAQLTAAPMPAEAQQEWRLRHRPVDAAGRRDAEREGRHEGEA